MKIPLKKTLNILITNLFIKQPIIMIYSGCYTGFDINSLKLQYIRACAKLCLFSKSAFFFKLKYPVYILFSQTKFYFSNISVFSLILFQFYKYIGFGSNDKYFFSLSILKKKVLSLFMVYLNFLTFGDFLKRKNSSD